MVLTEWKAKGLQDRRKPVKVRVMTYHLTLIADPARKPLSGALVRDLGVRFEADPAWFAAEEAVGMLVHGSSLDQAKAAAVEILLNHDAVGEVDLVMLPRRHRCRLLISDMDSTMITVECIDELADFAGVKAEVAAITRRAMGGELNFTSALHERVRLLQGLPVDVIDEVYRERVRLMPGARVLVQTMLGYGARAVLVSGGFIPFAERVASALGFEEVVANRLEIRGDQLTGKVLDPITGPDVKLQTMQRVMRQHDFSPMETLAVGDGANDLPMIKASGFGVAFRAHAPVAEVSAASIQVGDLTALLYLQGVPKAEFFAE
ncbi:MAG: phosphoserine phosphatase SerB [Geminicoccales bacterium]